MLSDFGSDHLSQMGGARGNDFNMQNMASKNPSTAAGTYMQGFANQGLNGNPGYMGGGLKSGGGIGKYPHESFDLDIMMPPDIASIDSDISNNKTLKTSYRQTKRDDARPNWRRKFRRARALGEYLGNSFWIQHGLRLLKRIFSQQRRGKSLLEPKQQFWRLQLV
jgi:hypothetical protein